MKGTKRRGRGKAFIRGFCRLVIVLFVQFLADPSAVYGAVCGNFAFSRASDAFVRIVSSGASGAVVRTASSGVSGVVVRTASSGASGTVVRSVFSGAAGAPDIGKGETAIPGVGEGETAVPGMDGQAAVPGMDGWEDIDRFLEQESSGMDVPVTFTDFMRSLLDGDGKAAGRAVLDLLKQSLVQEVSRGGKLAGRVLALGLAGAVFAGFSNVFSGSQVSETGCFLTYLLAFSALAAAFLDSIAIAGDVLQKQKEFMRALVPSYFLAVAWSGSISSSAAWLELVLILIGGIEWLYLNLLLPLMRVYLLLVLVGNMTKEDMFSRLTELLQTGIRWGTRSLFGLVLGFQVLQGMVLPYADAVQTGGLQKILQMIPGIGNGAGAAAKMLLGSGVLIKNTMGAAAAAILAVISLVPVVKLGILMGIYQLTAAILQPVGDKRLVSCVAAVADGQRTLVGMAVSGLLLFVITIALICAGSNVAYLA